MFSAFKFGEFASKALFKKKKKSIIHLDTSWAKQKDKPFNTGTQ